MTSINDLELTYTRDEIDGLHARAAANLKRLTRKEFLSRLQIVREVEPIVTKTWKEVERARMESQSDDSPHGHPWHVSFHGSQFPGNSANACPRQSLYRMMDFAPKEPFSRKGRTVMDVGKAMEVTLVEIFHEGGLLLSAPPDAEIQTGFEDPDAWFSSSFDCIIQPERWNKPLPIEVKTKDLKTLKRMIRGKQGPDESHIKQCKVEVAACRIVQRKLWPHLDLADHGVVYYMSRGDEAGVPKVYTAEFRVDYDATFWQAGMEKLREWRQLFIDGKLPQTNLNVERRYAHPFGWKWGDQPCAWCDFGKECREDTKSLTTDLLQSAGIERTKKVRPHYDPQEARERVFKRWGENPTT